MLLPFVLLAAAYAQAQDVAGPRLRAHVKFLASDLLEGRGVGTRGGDLAVEYLAAQAALLGLKPAGDDGTFFQRVPLVGVNPSAQSTLSIKPAAAAMTQRLVWLNEFVGTTLQQTEDASIDAEAVFVGHGISAAEFGWDDYQGVNVSGKVVVLFTGEPPSDDPNFFGGKALTYYGRWTYKYEEATRRGAIACIIIHTTPTASYGWDVVRSSWGREDIEVGREQGAHALAFAGWVTSEVGGRIFRDMNKTTTEALQMADTKGFHGIPLPLRFQGKFPAKVRKIESRNVVAISPGSDPIKTHEAVVFSAHWDHLGVGGAVNGDSIYNGAVDNATGCAVVLELARAWQALNPKPRRSAIFLFVTAEESGLLGSRYYADHPFVANGRTAVNLNFDSFYPFGRTLDVGVNGSDRTTVWPIVEDVAKRFRLAIRPDPHPERGSYYRSDHFAFARAGVPAFSINMGVEFAGKPKGFGERVMAEYNEKHYHQPSDQYPAEDNWDYAGMVDITRFGFTIGLEAANSEKLPTWRKGDEFLSARERSGVR
ncbi:MAG: M20/M25/M40 family metallo-hydrolase [Acidobacteria bacterium]|nr:M20/M25/M40 family metallo-hydrolase [Acidobacteriota bacterium]